jgi:hypothetical protein
MDFFHQSRKQRRRTEIGNPTGIKQNQPLDDCEILYEDVKESLHGAIGIVQKLGPKTPVTVST